MCDVLAGGGTSTVNEVENGHLQTCKGKVSAAGCEGEFEGGTKREGGLRRMAVESRSRMGRCYSRGNAQCPLVEETGILGGGRCFKRSEEIMTLVQLTWGEQLTEAKREDTNT